MEHRDRRASTAEIRRVAAAADRWNEARAARPRLWCELTDHDKEKLAIRRLRATAAAVGWDAVLRRLGVRRAEE
ncbi:MAG: hypothetical protein IT561_12130 [Alphaproteobacteria bacterium]|nr:hypothetical protein [Alphaproteobacteria bacterium]